jgi:uncharacterized membrane protein
MLKTSGGTEMLQDSQFLILCFAAVGCAIIGGVYFTFSAFVMIALGAVEREAGIAAMKAINYTILRSLFMPLFYGTTLAATVLAGIAIFQWSMPDSRWILVGSVVYLAGMFLVTVIFNVPMNNTLDQVKTESVDAAGVWADYIRTWTKWNHVRTIASLFTSLTYVAVLICG